MFFFSTPRNLLTLAVIGSLFMSSCGLFKSAQNKKVPSSYSVNSSVSYKQAMLDYVDHFKEIAMREQTRVGIPASITLAQGLFESGAGRSELATKGNNHFGIKCHSDWQGPTFYLVDDDYDPITKQLVKSCFRVYNNPEESYVAHSDFLRDPKKTARYGSLFQLPQTDYENWAQGLTRAGYATDPTYGDRLIKIIEDYQLHQYDLKTPNGLPISSNGSSVNNNPNNNNPNANYPNNNYPNNNYPNNAPNTNYPNTPQTPINLPAAGTINSVQYVRALGGISLEQVAARNDIKLANLVSYNDFSASTSAPLAEGTVIFLQRKRKYSNDETFVRVKNCETMYDIAQRYGISLERLYDRNKMLAGEQPMVGEKISLRRGWFEKIAKPQLRDTTGEWLKCHGYYVSPNAPGVVNRPTTNTPSSGLDFDISPSSPSNPQNSVGYVVPRPTDATGVSVSNDNQPNYNTPPAYPNSTTTSSYPSSSYPSTNSSTTSSYPSASYPSTNSNTTSSYPSASYPSTNSNTTSSYPSTTYPTTKPVTPTTKPVTPTYKPTPTRPIPVASNGSSHVVQVGETLWRISKQYNTTVDKLRALNNLPDNNIRIGQTLRIK